LGVASVQAVSNSSEKALDERGGSDMLKMAVTPFSGVPDQEDEVVGATPSKAAVDLSTGELQWINGGHQRLNEVETFNHQPTVSPELRKIIWI
jgi:hypothetical protein